MPPSNEPTALPTPTPNPSGPPEATTPGGAPDGKDPSAGLLPSGAIIPPKTAL